MIHIYSYDIRQSNPALERAAFQVLNIKKRKRIKKYVQNKDKLLSIYGNSLLRYSLSSQGNVLSNKKILENEYGKLNCSLSSRQSKKNKKICSSLTRTGLQRR